MHWSLDFLVCLHSVKPHSALRCLCLCKGWWRQQGFCPPLSAADQRLPICLPDAKLFTVVCLWNSGQGLSYHPRLHLSTRRCGTYDGRRWTATTSTEPLDCALKRSDSGEGFLVCKNTTGVQGTAHSPLPPPRPTAPFPKSCKLEPALTS